MRNTGSFVLSCRVMRRELGIVNIILSSLTGFRSGCSVVGQVRVRAVTEALPDDGRKNNGLSSGYRHSRYSQKLLLEVSPLDRHWIDPEYVFEVCLRHADA